MVRGYSCRECEIATDMAADVLSLTGGGDDLAPCRKDREHATKAASGALSVIAVRWGSPAGGRGAVCGLPAFCLWFVKAVADIPHKVWRGVSVAGVRSHCSRHVVLGLT